MAGKRIVHVIGTGTIGEPLIGLLSDMRQALGIDEVTFHKNTPRKVDRPKIGSLIRRGAHLAADRPRWDGFREIGSVPAFETEEAIARASVVIDCSPEGMARKNKARWYERHDGPLGYIAQGGEYGFGKMYARGINDAVLDHETDRFIQVASCNTHNIAVLLNTLGDPEVAQLGIDHAEFVCLRRANDISQDGGFVPSPQLGRHTEADHGTHHARDAWALFQTMGLDLDLFSSALKLNTQYMHALWFKIRLDREIGRDEVIDRLAANTRVALTEKVSANLVFSFGREQGYYGRLLNQTVVSVPTLHVRRGRDVYGFCFTPQDGNPLLSSVAATMWLLHPETLDERIDCLRPYMFSEV